MKYYSYDYVLSQISRSNWILAGLIVLLLLVTGFVSIKAYRDKKDTKYRELILILVLTVFMTVLIFFSSYQANELSDNQYRTSLRFIEFISGTLQVDKAEVYVNTSAATDGAIVYVKGAFYRAIKGSEPDTYLLEKLDLYKAEIELVEVEE